MASARRRGVAILLALFGVGAGLVAVALAIRGEAFSKPAADPAFIALLLAAGWSLALAGAWVLVATGRAVGLVLMLAGSAWFVSEWANPAAAPTGVFTVGLLLHSAWPPIVGDAISRWPPGRSRPRTELATLLLAYLTGFVILGLVPALAFDPLQARCGICPTNPVGVLSDLGLVRDATRLGYALLAAWVVALVVMAIVRLVRAGRVDRVVSASLIAPACVALGAVAADALYSLPRGFASNDDIDVVLWTVSAAALVATASGSAVLWVRRRQTRRNVARLALEVAAGPAPGHLQASLARILDDPVLEVRYPPDPLDDPEMTGSDEDAWIADVGPGRAVTRVERAGRPVALLVHRADLALDADRIAGAIAAGRLALENEAFYARSARRLRELRDARTRIVAASDAERRRLERDLHDGAQQRVLALGFDLALLRQRVAAQDTAHDRLANVESEVRGALAELRAIAHGIYPRTLADDGLAAALIELVETAAIPIDLIALPPRRVDREVEAALYLVAARATTPAAASRATLTTREADGSVILVVEATGAGLFDIIELEDRVGALGGTVHREWTGDGFRVQAVLPCAS